ncbi:MAG: hypothetical protein ACE5IJ_11560 [Thermoplasmata archaeon]
MNHLVVSCVGSKTLGGPRLRDIQGETVLERWTEWNEAIQERVRRGPLSEATRVYAGSLWNAYLEVLEEFRTLGDECRLWIVSAGLGLVSGSTSIPGYGATFKPGKEDSVAKDFSGQLAVGWNREWWRLLTETGLVDEPLTLSDLFGFLEPGEVLVMAMGGDYYSAVYENLGMARAKGEVVLIGLKRTKLGLEPEVPAHLRAYAVPYKDFVTLRKSLDCNMIQVHAYTARELVRHYRTHRNWNLRLDGLGQIGEVG